MQGLQAPNCGPMATNGHYLKGRRLNAFLDDSELVVLTGYVRPSMQVRWLQARQIPHEVNRFGRAVVRRDYRGEMAAQEPEMGRVP